VSRSSVPKSGLHKGVRSQTRASDEPLEGRKAYPSCKLEARAIAEGALVAAIEIRV